jgi:hypothetical protein
MIQSLDPEFFADIVSSFVIRVLNFEQKNNFMEEETRRNGPLFIGILPDSRNKKLTEVSSESFRGTIRGGGGASQRGRSRGGRVGGGE